MPGFLTKQIKNIGIYDAIFGAILVVSVFVYCVEIFIGRNVSFNGLSRALVKRV